MPSSAQWLILGIYLAIGMYSINGAMSALNATASEVQAAVSQPNTRIDYEHVDGSMLDQAQCLATNLYFEAGRQGYREQEAIGHVVINRVQSSRFPDTICSVVYQGVHKKNGMPIRNKCQFSWYCDGKSDKVLDHEQYDRSMRIAISTILARITSNDTDFTNNSLWYHAHYVSPYWAKDYRLQLREGAHLFYSRR